ncbi:lactosylceramide 4-alpha-galactosyltransferase-like [Ixodes scapularis]|uniref:lactosylceramide 4-alpha-galactosyltransferase-like n=1 Tax=Ixodes scapularis TaxID=6945 RepID=UPI001A9EBAE5|nr:lactosylceramide 4-alpha-galactosyltransferase-like [Ixodes scapularis]
MLSASIQRRAAILVTVLVFSIVAVQRISRRFYQTENSAVQTVSRQSGHTQGARLQLIRNTTEVRNIWFIESSGSQDLPFNQACAIESASLHNPAYFITLLTTGQLAASCEYCKILQTLPNFRSIRTDNEQAFLSSPMEAWYGSKMYNHSKYHVEHLSDALRYVTLWWHGGIYLDLDVITMRSLHSLTNCLVLEECGRPTNSILIFDKRHRFLKTVMKKCAEVYNPSEWTTCGPNLLQSLYQGGESSAQNLTFLKAETFLAIEWKRWKWFFEQTRTTAVFQEVRESYGVHLSNHLSKHTTFQIGSGCAYELLAVWNCPRSYKHLVSKNRSSVIAPYCFSLYVISSIIYSFTYLCYSTSG